MFIAANAFLQRTLWPSNC